MDRISVVCISDTHNTRPSIPDGDILIHAGDLTQHGATREFTPILSWIASLPHPIKIVIAGNHDRALDAKYCDKELVEMANIDWRSAGITYLEHETASVTIRGRTLRIFGSPYTPEFGNFAFQYPPARLIPERAHAMWEGIPTGVDILVTHGPPLGHLDETSARVHAGCPALMERLRSIRPQLHVFGHIHNASGQETIAWDTELQKSSGIWGNILTAASRFGPSRRTRLSGSKETILVNAAYSAESESGGARVIYLPSQCDPNSFMSTLLPFKALNIEIVNVTTVHVV